MGAPIVAVENLVKQFSGAQRGQGFRAVDRVSFSIKPGETLGLVGETGAGKSTIARCLLGLEKPTSGRIEIFGHDIASMTGRQWKQMRRELQAVFQDPKGAMNPRWSVSRLVAEPMQRLTSMPNAQVRDRTRASLEAVGLDGEFLDRYRHQLSGGQQQRVNIARAISIEPRCIVLDEPVAALDSWVKREIVKLLADLQRTRNLTYLLISHDLRIVHILCSSIVVLFRGRIVECGSTDVVMAQPRHSYTRQLLSAQLTLPGESGHRVADTGEPEGRWSLENRDALPPVGDLVEVASGHFVAEE